MARYSFLRLIPPKFERKLRRHKQRLGKMDTTVILDKDETDFEINISDKKSRRFDLSEVIFKCIKVL